MVTNQLSEEGLVVQGLGSENPTISLHPPLIKEDVFSMRRKALLLVATFLLTAACGGQEVATTQASTTLGTTTTTGVVTTATTAAPVTSPPTAAASTTTAPPPEAVPDSGFPVTVAGAEIAARPEAIVSLSPTSTETLFAIGAGDQVIAVDMASSYPGDAPASDLDGFNPNLEGIAAYKPDLVVISWDPGELISGLGALGIPVILHPPASDIDGAFTQMVELGAATGNVEAASDLVAAMQAEIEQAVDAFGGGADGITYYHELDDTYYTATSGTFLGQVYSLFGLENIADPADADGWGYPQLSVEYILESDPDLIFFGCGVWCGTTAESLAERPGWSGLTAVADELVVEVDDDLSSRWGPRLVEFVRLIADTLAAMLEGG